MTKPFNASSFPGEVAVKALTIAEAFARHPAAGSSTEKQQERAREVGKIAYIILANMYGKNTE